MQIPNAVSTKELNKIYIRKAQPFVEVQNFTTGSTKRIKSRFLVEIATGDPLSEGSYEELRHALLSWVTVIGTNAKFLYDPHGCIYALCFDSWPSATEILFNYIHHTLQLPQQFDVTVKRQDVDDDSDPYNMDDY